MELKARLSADLQSARARTIALLAAIPVDAQARQVSPLMSPLCWDLAHIAWFEELWLVRELAGAPPHEARFDDLYDAFRHPRRERAGLPILDPTEARDFADHVRKRALDVLDGISLDAGNRLLTDGFVYRMIVQHEHQHAETMLATIQLMDDIEYTPAHESSATPRPVQPTGQREVFVPAGPFVMGTDTDPWAYDNERPAHEVDVPAFAIDATPVTNEAFAAFIAAGGYDNASHWSDDGWAWRVEAALEHPELWRRADAGADAGAWEHRRFGRWEPVAPHEPVQHVCWYEADAFARWAGKRLPTEAEWEKAASWDARTGTRRRFPWGDDAPTSAHANLGRHHFGPSEIGSYPAGVSAYGVHQMLGDVWEWTASDFHGYPGFESFPYREYSEVFFGPEYKVLRGGAWGVDPCVARTTFRNWDYPIRRQIFAGFRCARDA